MHWPKMSQRRPMATQGVEAAVAVETDTMATIVVTTDGTTAAEEAVVRVAGVG